MVNLSIGLARGRLVPSWPLLVGLAGLARALAQPAALLHDPDTYLHIAAGRWMLAHGALPSADPFSHTMAGMPWLAPEWLAEIAFALVYQLAGWSGVVLLSAASFALALALLTRFLLRRVEGLPGVIAVAAGAAALLTPHGAAALVQPFQLMAMPALQAGFVEWLPPDFRDFPALEGWLLGIVAIAFATGVKVPMPRLVLLLALIHMALSHVRHADLLGLVGPLAVTRAAAGSALLRGAARLAAPAAPPALALGLALAAALALALLQWPLQRGDDPVTPASAAAAAARLGLAGPVFNGEAFGGYLAFAGVPSFIDGRIEMFGDAFLARYLEAERGDEPALLMLLDQYRIAWTLLPPEAGAVAALDRLPQWRRAYADARAVIHVRAGLPADLPADLPDNSGRSPR